MQIEVGKYYTTAKGEVFQIAGVADDGHGSAFVFLGLNSDHRLSLWFSKAGTCLKAGYNLISEVN